MTACMTSESGDIETVSQYIDEAKKMGFVILPPDINESFSDFTVVVEGTEITKKIRFGLNNIKNFGTEIGKAIIAERKEHGPFTTIENFLERVLHRNLNKKSLEALVMCGAMDMFGERGYLMANIEDMLGFNKALAEDNNKGSVSLFDGMDDAPTARLIMKQAQDISRKQALAWEKELLGLYISGHPLDIYKERFDKSGSNIKKIKYDVPHGVSTVIAGIVEDVREIYTKKNNDKMAFIRIKDLSDTLECVVFPKTFLDVRRLCVPETLVLVKGKVSERNGELSMIIDDIKELI